MYLATVTVCLLQLSGINTAIIYSGSLLEDAGFSERMQVVGVVIIGLILFLGVLPASYFMDIAGRRTLMMVSHAGMAASLAGVSAVGFAADGSDKTAAAVSLALICLFCLFFSVGAGPVPFTYVAEIVPEEIRGPGLGFATGTHWLANIAVGVSFPFLMSGLGQGGAYLIYAGLNVGGLLFATFHMVETKKRTLRELGRMLSSKPAPKAAQRRCIVD